MDPIQGIKQWQIDRGLASMPYEPRREIQNIVEELLEGIGRHDDKVTEWSANGIFMHENIIEPPTEEEVVDSIADQIVFNIGSLLKLNYEPRLVLKETLKEINSRGGSMGINGKWIKKITGKEYKADYSKCRRHK